MKKITTFLGLPLLFLVLVFVITTVIVFLFASSFIPTAQPAHLGPVFTTALELILGATAMISLGSLWMGITASQKKAKRKAKGKSGKVNVLVLRGIAGLLFCLLIFFFLHLVSIFYSSHLPTTSYGRMPS